MRFRELAQRALGPNDRVLVLGATGWFGTVTVDIALEAGAKVLAISGSARPYEIEHRVIQTHDWSEDLISEFNPTVVVDAAFLTREKLTPGKEAEYFDSNRSLMAKAYSCYQLPSLRAFIGFSSGAAITEPDKPYGGLKLEYEKSLKSLAEKHSVNTVVARAWSVSGPFVTKTNGFAFSDFVDQALRTRTIRIQSSGLVYRRYCSVQDFIALCLAVSHKTPFAIIDSGGPLVELGELAQTVLSHLNLPHKIERQPVETQLTNIYCSDSQIWETWIEAVGLDPLPLGDQVDAVIADQRFRLS